VYPSDILVPSSPFPRCCEESKICAMLLEMATHVNSEKIVKLHKTATQSIRWMDGPRRINGWRWLEERKDLGSTTPCQPITTARYHISLWWTRYYQRRGSTTPSSVQTAKPIPTKKKRRCPPKDSYIRSIMQALLSSRLFRSALISCYTHCVRSSRESPINRLCRPSCLVADGYCRI